MGKVGCDIREKWVRWVEKKHRIKGEIWGKVGCDIREKWVRWVEK